LIFLHKRTTPFATHAACSDQTFPTKSGGWFARKRIPADVQDDYEKLSRLTYVEDTQGYF